MAARMPDAPRRLRVRLDAQGRALIPKPFRDELGLDAPGEAIAWLEDGRLVIEARASLLARLRARYQDADASQAEALLSERREEATHEGNEPEGTSREDGPG